MIVVGLGPVGAVLAVLLGSRGRRVVVVERDIEPYPLPRAVAADDEVLRILSGLPGQEGLLKEVNGVQRAAFVDRDRRVLAEMAFGETPLGMPGLAFFSQPRLERALRRTLEQLPTVTLLTGHLVTGVRPRPTEVTVELAGGRRLVSRYVVGCDGAGSRVREVLGIPYLGRTASAPSRRCAGTGSGVPGTHSVRVNRGWQHSSRPVTATVPAAGSNEACASDRVTSGRRTWTPWRRASPTSDCAE